MKSVIWLGSSLADVRSFSAEARRAVGYQLYKVQVGLEPSDWKPLSSVGSSVIEIRVHAETEYRVIYIAKFAEAVYVLHGFRKKTRRTSKRDLTITAERLRALNYERSKS